jgi:GDPmannose 4,6-dehydratase
MKAIIFGANGQDAYYLSALLRNKKIDVIGVSRSLGELLGDVANFDFVERAVKTLKPDYIFHFAANSTTSHQSLFDNHQAISTGTLNILESALRHSVKAKIFLTGSAMQFRNDGSPINEQTPFESLSLYAVARIQSTYAGRYYREKFGMEVYCGYFFNHDSPMRTERHVNQKIVKAVKRIANGANEKLMLNGIYVEKEFNFAGDIVEAVWALINQNVIFEAVIGSGQTHSIKEWLEYCFGKINKDWEDFVIVDSTRGVEYKKLVSNPALIQSLAWRPKIKFEELGEMMMAT